jgi:hypothetical protein
MANAHKVLSFDRHLKPRCRDCLVIQVHILVDYFEEGGFG